MLIFLQKSDYQSVKIWREDGVFGSGGMESGAGWKAGKDGKRGRAESGRGGRAASSGGGKSDEFAGREWILVEQGAEGRVEVGELVFEGGRALKKGFYADGPEFGIAGCGVGIEEGRLAGLHALEYGAGYR